MSIKRARSKIRKAFENDPQFKETYVANVAMLIYDDQVAGAESRSTEPPTNLSTVEGCNSMAERIIDLIFSSQQAPEIDHKERADLDEQFTPHEWIPGGQDY